MAKRRNGSGNIRKLPSGWYQARRSGSDGKLYSLGSWQYRRDAEQALQNAEREEVLAANLADVETPPDGAKEPLRVWAERWMTNSPQWKPSTAAWYRNTYTDTEMVYLHQIPQSACTAYTGCSNSPEHHLSLPKLQLYLVNDLVEG